MNIHALMAALLAAATSAPGSAPFPAPAPAPAAAAQDPLGPMAGALRNRVGTWRVKAELQLRPGARLVVIDAIAENRLVGGRWLLSELRTPDRMNGGFEGVGINGYDPRQGKYVGYWIDGSRSLLIPVEGAWDGQAGLFRTTSVERGRDGRAVTVQSETRTIGPDEEVTTFTAPDAEGRPFVRMRLDYKRAAGAIP
jgi:hypothetical protein